jgi:hypothetical protein
VVTRESYLLSNMSPLEQRQRDAIAALQARVTALEDLVRRMRDAQQRYYKTREQTVLIEAKRLEREVDHALGGDHGAL